MSIKLQLPKVMDLRPRITVVGIGGAGGNAINNMIASGLSGVEFVVANTDAQALAASSCESRIQLGVHLTEGLGAGSKPEIGEAVKLATEQYRTTYLFHAPINYESNFVNITAPMAAKVTLDAAPVAGFKAIGATGYGVVRLELGDNIDGNHRVESDKPVGISVYGYGQYTSYWYPGGLDLNVIPQ